MPRLLNRSHNSGFGMIEVAVAFLVLSLSLGVLLGGLTVGLRNTDRAAKAGLALLYAESILAETGISAPLEEGESTGRTDGGFIWKRQISRAPDADKAAVASFTVSISVTPPDNGAPVRIVTQRLADVPSTDHLRP